MNKKLSLFLILSILAVQVLSTLHIADYGLEEHKHNGQICDVYLHSEQAKSAPPDTAITIALLEQSYAIVVLPKDKLIKTERYATASPRAPPVFS